MTSRTGSSRRGGNQAAVPLHGGINGGPQPLHRHILRAQKHSSRWKTFSVSPYEGDPLGLSLRGREPGSGGWAKPEPSCSPPKAFGGEQEGACLSQEKTRGVLRRRDTAIFPSVDRSSLWRRTSFPGRSRAQSFRNARTQESQNRRGPVIRSSAGGDAGARRMV